MTDAKILNMRDSDEFRQMLVKYGLRSIEDIDGAAAWRVESVSGNTYTIRERWNAAGNGFRLQCNCPARKRCRHCDAISNMRMAEAIALGDYDGAGMLEREEIPYTPTDAQARQQQMEAQQQRQRRDAARAARALITPDMLVVTACGQVAARTGEDNAAVQQIVAQCNRTADECRHGQFDRSFDSASNRPAERFRDIVRRATQQRKALSE